jgi:uncharacterized surface protein with fasciclin (FAS1) repeats
MKSLTLLLLSFGMLTSTALAADPAPAAAPAAEDLVTLASRADMTDVTKLVAAIKAAGLVDTLKGAGPFTIFAPTNAAFEKLPAGALDNLLKPENKEKLKAILLYHVHAGDAFKAAAAKTGKMTTANGKDLDVVATGGAVTINGAKVVKTDIVGKNGVIHLIDTVLMP